MKRCFIAIFLLLFSYNLNAQYAVAGANVGVGVLGNSNAPYFPGFGGLARCGINLGLMATDDFGFFTGVGVSSFSFSISDDRTTVANQSVTYLDVPFAIRYVIGANKHKPLKVYAQPGILLRTFQKSHYKPEASSTPPSHTTSESDNNGEFKKSVVSPFLQFGFILNISRVADMNFGGELSTATSNVINTGKYGSSGSLQGYAANMHLSYFAVNIGLQFHLGGSRSKRN